MRPFFRLSGGGNDFLALVEPASEPSEAEILALCRRGVSVGADGLFILERRSGGARMRYYNADGRPADLCLNGTRCAVRLACHLGWADRRLEIETGAGTLCGSLVGETVVALTLPRPPRARQVSLEVDGRPHPGWWLEVGVPHFVLPWPATLDNAPVARLGPALRCHPQWGDAGSNVDFVRFPDRHTLEIRTFERGVEAETLACGTGVLAATAVGIQRGDLELPVEALTRGGFELRVQAAPDSAAASEWSLIGDARLLAEGVLLPDASASLPGARWS